MVHIYLLQVHTLKLFHGNQKQNIVTTSAPLDSSKSTCMHVYIHSDTVYILALGDFLDGRCMNNMNKLQNN